MSEKQTDSTNPTKKTLLVHWFRRGLRLHDNPAFSCGLQQANTFRCIYILDPYYGGTGINKWRLFVIRGQPLDVFPRLIEQWELNILSFEEEPEPHGRERDKKIEALVQSLGVKVIVKSSHTLYDLPKLLFLNDGVLPLTYREFLGLIRKAGRPNPPVVLVDYEQSSFPNQEIDLEANYSVPTLRDLGFDKYEVLSNNPCWLGGETEALARLQRHIDRKTYVAACDGPTSLLPQSTGLSPYLRFGCLSPKLLYSKLEELHIKMKKCPPPLSLFGQLLWRDFFYLLAYNNPNFDSMNLNPLCVQIPWDRNPKSLAKWANAHTGYPLIDAIMSQLRTEGCIHHLCKHATVCFLTRGDLFLSWEDGAKVFEELSLDGDWALNNGTLLWLSGSSFFQTILRSCCPVKFGKRVDPQGNYIKKYVPALKDIPQEYIHEPWKASKRVQEDAGCLIGSDYPVPMVEHSVMVKLNTRRLVQAYQFLVSFQGFRESRERNTEAVSTEKEGSRTEPSQNSTSTLQGRPVQTLFNQINLP